MTRVVVAGLGDTGLLTAVHLARHSDLDLVGISTRPALVSGQELGLRLARPDTWAADYRIDLQRFHGLDRVRVHHAEAIGLDLEARTVGLRDAVGSVSSESYDVLVIATGVSNGFWRSPEVRDGAQIDHALAAEHQRIADAASVLVVGGGAAAVSSAYQVALRWPEKVVMLAFPGERPLLRHHPRTWRRVEERLRTAGVDLIPHQRADLTDVDLTQIGSGSVRWTTGQPGTSADAIVWATGSVSPHTGWLPPDLLDKDGFVRVTPELQTVGHPEVFAVGDVAATDPLRSSARNRADKLLARNVRAHLAGGDLGRYRPPSRRWGSVLGVEPDGLRVFAPTGQGFRFPAWSVRHVLNPWIVRRGIYRGIRT
jgi:NADH dehydrogenase FAD-containing subunit